MSDLISRKALIEKIRKYGICGSGYSDEERINDVIDMIESEPTAQQWIPVEERLPKQGERIIGTFDNGNGRVIVMEEQFFIQLLESPYPLIAWMPLPEPYKGE